MQKLTDWIKKNAALLLGGLAVFVMMTCFVSGCNYHKHRHPCPEITTHTVIIHDTLIYNIVDSFPYYISHTDTIVYPDTIIQPVDTAEILRDYFALHVYDRHWEDSLLAVDLRDTVTQNRFLHNDFSYKILRPQQIINYYQDNSVHYSKYIYGGVSIPFNIEYASIDILSTFKRGYFGIGYAPLQKGVSLKGGLRLFTWE
jgi:hypothetical protein